MFHLDCGLWKSEREYDTFRQLIKNTLFGQKNKQTNTDEGDRDQRRFWNALGGEVEIKPAASVTEEPEYVKKLFR